MQIKLIKKCGWKKVYLNVLDKEYNIIRTKEITIKNNEGILEFNNDKDFFYYLSNEKDYKTEIVILSKNTSEVYLKYNRKKRRYYIYLNAPVDYYKNVESIILKDEVNLFFRPDKSKKIDILLPIDYDSNKKYGLLIMFDGQNLFDLETVNPYTDKNDPYGSWQVDKSMSMLRETLNKEFIVVGIEHTDYLRTNELITPSSFGKLRDEGLFSEEEKEGYIDYLDNFINETLLPYIYSNYSIDKNMMGISGSSMGGLGCHYIGLKNLGKYHFILCYTPASALIVDSAWNKFYKKLNFKNNLEKLPIFYLFQGEGDDLEKILAFGNTNLISNLINNGYPKELTFKYIEPSAYHNEVAWRYAFNYMIYEIFK